MKSICIDYNMPFSILALVSSRDSHIGLEALAEGRYGSRDDTRANMEKHVIIFKLFITYLSVAEKRENKFNYNNLMKHNR